MFERLNYRVNPGVNKGGGVAVPGKGVLPTTHFGSPLKCPVLDGISGYLRDFRADENQT